MRPRLRIFSALLTLSLLAFVDHQYFYEPERAAGMNPLLRQLVHLLVLLLFIPVGRRALRTRPGAWVRPFWTGTYLSLLGTLMTAGLLQWQLQCIPLSFLDFLSGVRAFFTSPFPLAILYYLGRFSAEKINALAGRP